MFHSRIELNCVMFHSLLLNKSRELFHPPAWSSPRLQQASLLHTTPPEAGQPLGEPSTTKPPPPSPRLGTRPRPSRPRRHFGRAARPLPSGARLPPPPPLPNGAPRRPPGPRPAPPLPSRHGAGGRGLPLSALPIGCAAPRGGRWLAGAAAARRGGRRLGGGGRAQHGRGRGARGSGGLAALARAGDG